MTFFGADCAADNRSEELPFLRCGCAEEEDLSGLLQHAALAAVVQKALMLAIVRTRESTRISEHPVTTSVALVTTSFLLLMSHVESVAFFSVKATKATRGVDFDLEDGLRRQLEEDSSARC